MDKVSLNLYTRGTLGRVSIDGALGGAWDQFRATRRLCFASTQRYAEHEQRGYDVMAHLGLSREISLGSCYASPFGNIDYVHLYQKGFTETGAGALCLNVQGKHSDLLRSECGIRLASSSKGSWGSITSAVQISGIQICYLVIRHYQAAFHHQEISYAVRTFSHPIYLVSPGLDLQFKWNRGLTCSLHADFEYNSEVLTKKYSGYFGWAF